MRDKEGLFLLDVSLRLFDGGGGDGGAGAGEGGSQSGKAPAGGSGPAQEGAVRYGKQPPGPEEKPAEEKPAQADGLDDRKRRWRELVGGEFRDLYTEDTRRLTDRQARQTEELRGQLERYQPVVDMLMERYKITDGDPGKLRAAVENDSAYWSQAAEEAGMSVEQYKQLQKLQRENAQLLRQQRQRQGEARVNAQLQRWFGEAEAMRTLYPSFDLNAEVQNPQFLSMLKAGVPVQQAYEVLHMDEIKAGIAAMQAKATEQQVVAGIRTKGARPAENGTSAQSGFTLREDVHKLTKKDRAEIAKRAARGEVITF